MPHALAGAFEQAGRIIELGAEEETDIRMSAERVDVAEGCVSRTRCRMAVVQQLANVQPTAAHLLEPWQGELSQRVNVIGLRKPGFDAEVSACGTRKPEELAHPPILPRVTECVRVEDNPGCRFAYPGHMLRKPRAK